MDDWDDVAGLGSALRAWLAAAGDEQELAGLGVAAALLELGRLDEGLRALGDEAVLGLEPDELGAARAILADAVAAELACLEHALDQVEASGDDELCVPAFAADPAQSASLLATAREMLACRERLHRLAQAGRLLGGEVAATRCDVRLRSQMPRLSALDPDRIRASAELPDPEDPQHWWWTWPVEDPEEEAAGVEDRDERPFRTLADWIRARTADPGVLRLDRDEARALLATPRGQALADWLGPRLDLGAARPSDSELAARFGTRTLGELADPGPRPARSLPGELYAKAEQLLGTLAAWLRPQPTLAYACHTATCSVAALGDLALTRVAPERVWLVEGLGVVARGTRALTCFDPQPEEHWLLLPALGLRALGLPACEQARVLLAWQWEGGGVLLKGASLGEVVHAAWGSDDPDHGLCLHLPASVEPTLPEVCADPCRVLLAVLAALAFGQLEPALELWDAWVPGASELERSLGSGLSQVVEAKRRQVEA